MQAEISSEVEAPSDRTDTFGLTKIEVLMKRQVIHQYLYCYLIGRSVRCSEKQMLKSPINPRLILNIFYQANLLFP